MYAGRMCRSAAAIVVLVSLAAVACAPEPTDSITTTSPPVSTVTTAGASTTTTTEEAPSTLPLSELVVTFATVDSGFNDPVLLVADPDGGADFVVEQPGRIVRADRGEHAVALDIRDVVRFGGEQGLLGLAFHPSFEQNRLAYVNYTDTRGRTVIAQFVVHDGTFDASSLLEVLVVDQPARNHNGGMIAFGPSGYMWIGMGDGGAANDSFHNGQNPNTLLGAMLRISVPGTDGAPYDIPESNPYAEGNDGAPEVYWTGLRNPWRFAFDFFADGVGADVWIADVGQNNVEEVSVMFTGNQRANFGWPVMEGSECFRSDNCDRSAYVPPVSEYRHDEGCSITGGYVYRGDAIPELAGHFFYSDFCTGFVKSYSLAAGDYDWTPVTGPLPSPSGFGIGGDGELYLVSHSGTVYRLERVE
jgi:glucose/arabinose dehydrogenase